MSIIEVENLTFKYNQEGKEVLRSISLSVEKGEFISVIGHNGSGKSTLARLLNGLLTPTSGTVKVFGNLTSDKKKIFDVRKSVGVVFQNPDNQLVASIVEDDIAFGPENLGVPRKEIGERIDFALKAVGMEEFRKSTPTRLSGGQKQRIAIAGVLAIKPEVIILDESTAMLDPKGRREVMDVVSKLNKENGMTVINITHYMDEVVEADRVFVLNEGEIVMQGTPTEIFARGEELEKYDLDVPVPTKIANVLREKGLDLGENIYSKEILGERLCASLQKI